MLELSVTLTDSISTDWKYPVGKGFLENSGNPLLF